MAAEDVELVGSLFAAAGGGEVDFAGLFNDEAWLERVQAAVAPDATIRFLVPERGGIEVMEQSEFRGPDGLREGWRIWLVPWEQFRVSIEEVIDVGDRGVLVLARAVGKTKDSGIEIPQETATLQRVENGKIVAMGFYLDPAQARRDAGLA
jgi:hypothetical protein